VNTHHTIRAMKARIRAAGRDMPKADGGTPICVAYFKRGQCFANCNNKHSHRRLSEAEKARYVVYIGDEAGR